MKVFSRILFALLAVLMYWIVRDYTVRRVQSLYYENEGYDAITSRNFSFFNNLVADYYDTEAIYTQTSADYELYVFESNSVSVKSSELNIETNLIWYIIPKTEIEELSLKLLNENSTKIYLHEFHQLGVYIHKENVDLDKPIDFQLQYNDSLINISILGLNNSEKISTYYEDNHNLPGDELNVDGINQTVEPDLTDYNYVGRNNSIFYILGIAISYYIVFVLTKRYLGKKKPSDVFISEQEKYYEMLKKRDEKREE